MAVPKRKSSKRKCRARKASHATTVRVGQACPVCSAPKEPHRVCPSCGQYRGVQVLTVASA